MGVAVRCLLRPSCANITCTLNVPYTVRGHRWPSPTKPSGSAHPRPWTATSAGMSSSKRLSGAGPRQEHARHHRIHFIYCCTYFFPIGFSCHPLIPGTFILDWFLVPPTEGPQYIMMHFFRLIFHAVLHSPLCCPKFMDTVSIIIFNPNGAYI